MVGGGGGVAACRAIGPVGGQVPAPCAIGGAPLSVRAAPHLMSMRIHVSRLRPRFTPQARAAVHCALLPPLRLAAQRRATTRISRTLPVVLLGILLTFVSFRIALWTLDGRRGRLVAITTSTVHCERTYTYVPMYVPSSRPAVALAEARAASPLRTYIRAVVFVILCTNLSYSYLRYLVYTLLVLRIFPCIRTLLTLVS